MLVWKLRNKIYFCLEQIGELPRKLSLCPCVVKHRVKTVKVLQRIPFLKKLGSFFFFPLNRIIYHSPFVRTYLYDEYLV